MRKVIVSAWVTLDGVFDADTMDQWFNPYHSDDRGDYIKDEILACDALLMGRTTYDMLAPYWSALRNNEMGIADKMNSVAKYVVSSTLTKADWHNSTLIRDAKRVVTEISQLKQQPGQDILIPGSATLVQSLLETGLIDEVKFLVHPIIMGSGQRFFKEGMDMTRLELVETKTFSLGVVLLCYKTTKKELKEAYHA